MREVVYKIGTGLCKLPNYYGFVEDTQVHFPEEHILLTLENTGKVLFSDEAGKELAQTFVAPDTQNGKHDNAWCRCENGKICVFLPIVSYEDNYPYCDGEYDRWTAHTIGYDCVTFDAEKGTLEAEKLKSME